MSNSVYLITNLANGKRYIGSTKFTLEERWGGHCYDAFQLESPMRLHRAIRKYGKDQFKIELLEECETREQAYEREGQLIREMGTHVTLGAGYNVTFGKGGATRGMTGKKHSAETRAKMSESHRGHRHTEAAKQKMSAQRKGAPRGPYITSKVIEQLNGAGEVVARFQTLTEACAQFDGKSRSHIWECCVGKRKQARGFTWRHTEG